MEQITPIHQAIHSIDRVIADLRLQRSALVALLPKKKPTRDVELYDPRKKKEARK